MVSLAKLEVGVHNEVFLLEDLNKIISWIDKLKEADTAGVKPLVTMALEAQYFPRRHPVGILGARKRAG
jgi:Asp-tRNA(Asn)/Glu-tRNA(Gln) amidotransferase C subunit